MWDCSVKIGECARATTGQHFGALRTGTFSGRPWLDLGLELTQSADLLPEVQPGPLVGDGLQHLLQGSVHLAVLLRWPSSLTQSRDGRHLRAGIMTIRGFTAGGTGG